MGKLYQSADGWKFKSDNGIIYSIYRGVGDGTESEYSSDIAFIVLDEYGEDEVDTMFVNWLYGASFIGVHKEQTLHIGGYVKDFEKTHPALVDDLCTPNSFIDDEEKMADFFIMTKESFLQSYSYLRERDYDETAKELAHKIASIRTWK